MDDEKLEEFIERLETLIEGMSGRIAKLEEQINNPTTPPVGLSTPMTVHASRPPVGFRWSDMLPIRLRSNNLKGEDELMVRLRALINHWRLNTPETRDLVIACERMRNDWSETKPDSPERRRLWVSVHAAADRLADKAGTWPL